MVTTQQAPVTSDEFDSIYAAASGDTALVPWADDRPHPALVTWLNAVAPSLIRCGGRVMVVGCGLGHDAREIRRRGYDVTAFDYSSTAIDWAKSIEPDVADCFHVADLFDLPSKWRHRFDLVVEVNTIQSLPPEQRPDVVAAISELLSTHGAMLVICRGAEESVPAESGPPWPMTEAELGSAAEHAGLKPDGPISMFLDDEIPPVLRMRALLRREKRG